MLQTIREKAKTLVTLVVFLLILSTLMWGINDFFGAKTNPRIAAVINGQSITWETIDRVFDSVRPQLDPAGVNPEVELALKTQLQQRLVQQIAAVTGSYRLGFRVPQAQLHQAILQEYPQFQVDGQFSEERYSKMLAQAHLSEQDFLKQLKQELLRQQVQKLFNNSYFISDFELQLAGRLFEQSRDIGYTKLSTKSFKQGISPEVKDLKEFYEKNQKRFEVPEKVKIEYIQLSLDNLMKETTVDDQKLKKFYEEHTHLYTRPEQVQARHILFIVPRSVKEGSEEDLKVRQKAQDVLELLAQGGDFTRLVKQYSEDPGTKDSGGDLGWLEKGELVPEFEHALFALKTPGTRAPITRTPFGYHVIEMTGHRPEAKRTFQEVRLQVREHYLRQEAQPKYEELAESLGSLAFENPTNLQDAAQQLKLQLETSDFFTRAGHEGVTQNSSVIKAVFSPEILLDGHNSEIIALDANNCLVLRVAEHKPAVIPQFNEIEFEVIDAYIEQQALQKMQTVASLLLSKLQNADATAQELMRTHQLKWFSETNVKRDESDLDPALLNAAFNLPQMPSQEHQASVQMLSLNPHEIAIVRLDKVIENTNPLDEAATKLYRQSLISAGADLEYNLFTNELFRQAKITLNPPPQTLD